MESKRPPEQLLQRGGRHLLTPKLVVVKRSLPAPARYGCLTILAYYLALAVSSSLWLVAGPVGLIALILLALGKGREMLQLLGSRAGQRSLWFLLGMTGLGMLGYSWLQLFELKHFETTSPLSLTELEAGHQVPQPLPAKIRLAGPLDMLYGLGKPYHGSSKNPNWETGWYYPVISSKHAYFGKMDQGPPPPEATFPIYFLTESKIPHSGHEIINATLCLGTGSANELERQGAHPRLILRRFMDQFEEPLPSADWPFYVGCSALALGLAMFVGGFLRAAQPEAESA